MFEGRRFRLEFSEEQAEKAEKFAAVTRCVYNLAREQRETAYRMTGKSPGFGAQCKDLTELRASESWIRAAPVHTSQQAIKDCENAYEKFFHHEAGYPGWRKEGADESFRYPDPEQFEVRKLSRKWWEAKLPKLGWCRFRWSRPFNGQIRNITISKDRRGRWWASFCVDTGSEVAGP